MNKKDLKRDHALFDDSDQCQTDAKKIQLESDHQSEGLGNHANCHDVKFNFAEACRDLAIQGKVKQIASKHMNTINDCSSPGKNVFLFIFVKYSSYVKYSYAKTN